MRRYRRFLLALIGSLDAAQPLDKTLEFFIAQLGSSFPHVDSQDAPTLLGTPRLIDSFNLMARGAGPIEKSFRLRIGKERRDLRSNVSSGEWFCLRTELADDPIQKQRTIVVCNSGFAVLVFRFDQLFPTGAVKAKRRRNRRCRDRRCSSFG